MFFLFLPSAIEPVPLAIVSDNIIRALEHASGRSPRTWSLDPLFVATTSPNQLHLHTSGGRAGTIKVLDGTAPSQTIEDFLHGRAAMHRAPEGAGCFNFITFDGASDELVVESEENAFRPLYIHIRPAGSVAISSHVGLIAEAFRDLSVNESALFQQLAVSACVADAALLDGVKRLEPGAVLALNRHGSIKSIGQGRTEHVNQPFDEAIIDRLWDLAGQAVTTSVKGNTALVALSGGLDSRFLALAGRREGMALATVTLGRRGWIDVDLASAFASAASVSHRIVEPSPDTCFDDYRSTVIEVEHLSDYLSPFWLGHYRAFLRSIDVPVINGFLGGPISGGLGNSAQNSGSKSTESVERYLDSLNRCAVRWESLRRVSKMDVDGLRRQICAHANELTAGEARPCRHLEMRFRQFGFVVLNTVNLYRKYCSAVAPFADTRMVRFFLDLPEEQLAGQALYRRALSARDHTGVPLASTTAQLYRPETFTNGPIAYLYSSFEKIRSRMVDYVLSNRSRVDHIFQTDRLAMEIGCATVDDSGNGQLTFTEAIALVNAVVWLVQRGLRDAE